MAVSRVHTWIAGEVLLASDLNSEFNNILTNGTAVAFPATAAVSMGGFALNFDAANTMSLVSSTKGLNLSSTTAINDVFTTVVSATTPDIWTAVGGVVNYTGTVTATGFVAAPQAGARRTLVCAGAAVFTAGANVLIDGVVSGSNYTAAAGDSVEVIAVTTTQFRLKQRLASGAAPVTSTITNSLGSDVVLNNTGTYFTGPTIAQGTVGTWFASGTITVTGASGDAINAKLWDGTTVIASCRMLLPPNGIAVFPLSGYITTPAGNIRISANDATGTAGSIVFNSSGNSKDSTVSAVRVA